MRSPHPPSPPPDTQAHLEMGPSLLLPPKPYKSYSELIAILKERGMVIRDEDRAIRKLSQIGYYRLSGYWHPCRKPILEQNGDSALNKITNVPEREDNFFEGTKFDDIIKLYLFDKKLRLLLLDAIERIEIHIRSVIAHELGKFDHLAYKKTLFIFPKCLENYEQKDQQTKNKWRDWSEKNEKKINDSKDIYVKWHKNKYKEIPIWVITETWDFGLMSNYYNILGDKYKDMICQRIEVPNKKTLNNWLQEINMLRNKCAHHSRIWNMRLNNALSLNGFEHTEYFNNLSIEKINDRKRIYGCICVLWYLVKQIGPGSTWINKVADHIDSLPLCHGIQYQSMGFPDERGFPRDKFDLPARRPLSRLIHKIKALINIGNKLGMKMAETKDR